ncbi:uncharacterized protein LOC129770037 [Toxorhynchites rutilus septentrionalis]|uniref:uncharacterized protein LOC129770037 n=1 Tax=Toxorhynchites rutilus septentrionalis TaxID=329112 RepID=UPI00247A2F91|nr:uncharacterized protein LOC129770037 [Toxorhynchites rutilus septentrionalis]
MPRTRNSVPSKPLPSNQVQTVVQIGKRRSAVCVAFDDKVVKKLKQEHNPSEDKRSRKLKNITNIADQAALTGDAVVEAKKRKLSDESRVLARNFGSVTDEAAVITEAQDKLKNVLGKHYFDAGARLNLDYVPGCLRNVSKCAECHARRTSHAKRLNLRWQRDTKELLVENRPMQFLGSLDQAFLRNEFIDSDLFVATLEMILTINKPSLHLNADYSIPSVLERAVEIMDRTVERFTPCWLDLKVSYQNIIFGRLEESCFARYDLSEGLFKVVFVLLERCVESEEEIEKSVRSTSNERWMATFHMWEVEHNQKYDFDLLNRDDQLERLFLVLQVLVKILEIDLAMWILRHPHKTKENLIKPTRRPLVASLLWHDHSIIGEVNTFIKRIINLYVNVVALSYPDENIKVVSRLLSVIATAINLSEIQYDGTIDYPCIKDNTRYFAHQISRQIEASNYYSVSLWLRSIQQTRSSLVRMLLVDEFILKLNHKSNPPSAASYLKHLTAGRWKTYRLHPPPNLSPSTVLRRYPFLDGKKQRKASHEISASEYVNLLLIGFRSYAEVFPLSNYFRSIKCNTVVSRCHSSSSSESSFPITPTRSQLKNHRYDFALFELHIHKLSKKRKPNRPIVRNSVEARNANPMVLEEINVTPALLVHYRDEVKHLLLIQRWLRTKTIGCETEQELFAPWRKYLAQIDDTLSCE